MIFIAQMYLGVVLVWAAFAKLMTASAFAETITRLKLLPASTTMFVARGIIVVELVIGASLLFSVSPRAAAITAALLFAVFAGVIGVAVWRRLPISCNCFGVGADEMSITTLLRATALAAVSIIVATAGGAALPMEDRAFGIGSIVIVVGLCVITRLAREIGPTWRALRIPAHTSATMLEHRRVRYRDFPLVLTPTGGVSENGVGSNS